LIEIAKSAKGRNWRRLRISQVPATKNGGTTEEKKEDREKNQEAHQKQEKIAPVISQLCTCTRFTRTLFQTKFHKWEGAVNL